MLIMDCRILFIIIYIMVSRAQKYYIVFNQNNNELSKCIEYQILSCDDPYYKELGIEKDVANTITKRFNGRSFEQMSDFHKATNQLFYDFQKRKSHLFKNGTVHKPLRLLIRKALYDCVYNRQVDLQTTPVFVGELYEVGAVLDYILVDWPRASLYDMICNINGRALLRRYAEDAGVKLAIALNRVNDHDYFRYLLRSYWMGRAQYYFDGSDGQISYLHHQYTLENPFPHIYENLSAVFSRYTYNISERNPLASPEDFVRIMSIHPADRPGYGEFDPFSVYERHGSISQAEYYIESHIDQFYRILFFFMELQTQGIDDFCNDMNPYVIIPVRLQEMIYFDHEYTRYLLSLRKWLETTIANNSHLQIVVGPNLSSARVREEDLISLLSVCGELKVSEEKKNTTTALSTPISITTLAYNQSKREGSSSMSSCRKRFCKQFTKLSCGQKEQSIQDENNNYGYISSYDNFYTVGFLTIAQLKNDSYYSHFCT